MFIAHFNVFLNLSQPETAQEVENTYLTFLYHDYLLACTGVSFFFILLPSCQTGSNLILFP